MITPIWQGALACLAFFNLVRAQDCGLPCIADVSGTTCGQSEWSCLCGYDQYLQRVSDCAQNACNQADYDSTIAIIAEVCGIFNDTASIAPYATASTSTQNPILSTVALSTSLPSVVSTTGGTGASSPAASQDIAGTSISTITTTGVPTESGALPTASSTTTNIARRLDMKSTALYGIAVALLGLAVYL